MRDMKLCELNHHSIANLSCFVCGRNVTLNKPHFVVNSSITCHPDCALALAFIEEGT